MKKILGESDFENVFEFQKSQKDRVLSIYGKTEDLEKAVSEKKQDVDDFKHHRLMAGYHSSKADEISKEALHLNAATNADLHGIAKEKKGEETRHRKTAEEYRNKAKSLHDLKKHGNWNDSVPTQAEALSYGSKQSKTADKKTNLIEKEEDMETDYKKDDGGLEFADDIKKKTNKK